MEIYVDSDGNEVSVDQLKSMFGENWETEAKNLGYSKKAQGVVATDATVTPVEPVASENTVSSSVGTSSDSIDDWEVVMPTPVQVVVPQDRKFGDIIEIPDFETDRKPKFFCGSMRAWWRGTLGPSLGVALFTS